MKCADCCKDAGVFNTANKCCRERHYRMTLAVSETLANSELAGILKKHGEEEAAELGKIEAPTRIVRPVAAKKPVMSSREIAMSSF